ncbi:serine protease [Gemmata sp. JC717]|uniref:Serine protease n=1 Tax=Gemmata algarum TaxID=2975278 RepID=A0ABU5ESJ0_9BACT|nr:serine protease [Gemmata algarum]MDY3552157.1 serine protease [Gemmata algarum]MDY3558307.1 serine protease [Gemmata algarum]
MLVCFVAVVLAGGTGAEPTGPFPAAARERGVSATVKVTSAADDKTGSGVVIRRTKTQAFVLTAAHVVEKAKVVEVQVAGTKDKPGTTLKAEVLERGAAADLAVLRLTADGVPEAVPLAPVGGKPKLVLSVGWEKGAAPGALDEVLKGQVRLRKPGAANVVTCFETVRKQAEGRSGGPLLDECGRVIGVATGHDGKTGYYVHADEVRSFLKANALGWIIEEDR